MTGKSINKETAIVSDSRAEAGLSRHQISVLCPDWPPPQSVRKGGLKCSGLIKADYKGGECAGIRLR